jgi:glycosyltransferase involved in cell wall biosynthesis
MVDILWTLWAQRKWIDIQMLQIYSGPGFIVADIASAMGKALGQKLVFSLRGGSLPEFSRRHPGWVQRVLQRADRLVAPSCFLARELSWLGLPVQVIPNHIDIERYPFQQRAVLSPKLFWMRTFHPIYNPGMAVRVLERLRADSLEASLVMAGPDETCLHEIQRLVKNRGLQSQVTFPGYLDPQTKVRLASEQDIYLNTSRVDNMPVTMLEMGALGLPMVATRVGGVPDIITDGESGLFVPNDDDWAMAEAVKRLLHEPRLAERLSQAGRKIAESYTWENTRDQWVELIHGLY